MKKEKGPIVYAVRDDGTVCQCQFKDYKALNTDFVTPVWFESKADALNQFIKDCIYELSELDRKRTTLKAALDRAENEFSALKGKQ